MCGIAGAIGVEETGLLDSMAVCQSHRGPDSTGTHVDGDVQLSNQRLSIIDLEGGDQPIYNEDGDVIVTYNGEIYNYRSLRDELKEAGHEFSTASDTEVLVHGYEEWDTGVFERLNGMFAVAIYDASDDRVLLARDRVGIKPLYIAPAENGLLFASEPKAILQAESIHPAPDLEAIGYFLQMRYSPSHTTLFDGIDTVLPGTYHELTKTNQEWDRSVHRFWELSRSNVTPPTDPESAIRETLQTAVERQLVSDVPIGFYLSGGLDTSSVVAMASQLSDDPIHTFCMGFEGSDWDERTDARVVADAFDTTHHELTISESFMDDFPRMIWHADEPKRNLYPFYVAKEMADHVKVALGGLGADELFGGYVYRLHRMRQAEMLRTSLDASTANWLRDFAHETTTAQLHSGNLAHDSLIDEAKALAHLEDPAQLYVLFNSTDVLGDTPYYRERVFSETFSPNTDPPELIEQRWENSEDWPLEEATRHWDFLVKLPDDFLLVEDRMSMAHSLESRVPFLDNEMIDLAFSIPLSDHLEWNDSGPSVGKHLLRRAMRDVLPDPVFEKDKQGFTMPTFPFVRDRLLEHARSILADPYVVREGIISESYLDSLLTKQPSRDLVPHYKLLWKIVALEIWYQMYFIDGASGPRAIERYYT